MSRQLDKQIEAAWRKEVASLKVLIKAQAYSIGVQNKLIAELERQLAQERRGW